MNWVRDRASCNRCAGQQRSSGGLDLDIGLPPDRPPTLGRGRSSGCRYERINAGPERLAQQRAHHRLGHQSVREAQAAAASVRRAGFGNRGADFLWTEYLDADTQLVVGFGPDPKLLDINDFESVQKAVETCLTPTAGQRRAPVDKPV